MQITELIVNVKHILVGHRKAKKKKKKIEKTHLKRGRNLMIYRQIKLYTNQTRTVQS